MGALDFAQKGVGLVVLLREMVPENAGSTLSADEVGNVQQRHRATFWRE